MAHRGGLPQPNENKAIDWRTDQNLAIDFKSVSDGLANRDSPPDGQKETAATAGTDRDGNNTYEAGQLPPHDSPLWHGAPDIIARHFAGMLA